MKPWVDGTRVWGYPASLSITSYFPAMEALGTWERRGLKVQGGQASGRVGADDVGEVPQT